MGANGLGPLVLWAPFLVLMIVARRDRRLLYRLPAVGTGVLAGLAVGFVIWRRFVSDSPAAEPGTAFLHWAAAVAGGFALPAVWSWCRAYWTRDLPRVWRRVRAERAWVVQCALLALFATGAYFVYGRMLLARGGFEYGTPLFEADTPLYIDIMDGSARDYGPAPYKHPLFTLVGRAVGLIVMPLVTQRDAPIAANALAGGLCLALAAQYFRLILKARLPALLLTALLGTSAAHVVFASNPETYAFSAVALVLLHLLLAARQRGGVRIRHEIPAAVLAAGITLTHVYTAAVCYVAGGRGRRWLRRLGRWGTCLIVVMAVMWVMQVTLLPRGGSEQAGVIYSESRYVTPVDLSSSGQTLWNLVRGICVENVVGAAPVVLRNAEDDLAVRMGLYTGAFNRGCAAVWVAVLMGTIGMAIFKRGAHRPTLWAALFCLLGSAALHTFYGNDHIFLFSCTFTFCVVAVVAHGLAVIANRWRVPAVVALGLFVAVNNLLFCGWVLDALDQIAVQRNATTVVEWSQTGSAAVSSSETARNAKPPAVVGTISNLPHRIAPVSSTLSTSPAISSTVAAPRSIRLTRPTPLRVSPS